MIDLVESECDCAICSSMCQGPCSGTVEEMENLITLGYADRLMIDDDPHDVNPEPTIKPALKGYEGKRAPYHTRSKQGCTFWINGKCELHDKKLKPFQGRYAHHDLEDEKIYKTSRVIINSWRQKKAQKLIEKFKLLRNIPPRQEEI